jgi:hypothetical protein
MASIMFKIDGDEQIISFGLNAFVKSHGWKEDSEIDTHEYARNIIRNFIRESVAAYVSKEAEKAAKEAAMTQAVATMNQLNSTLELL